MSLVYPRRFLLQRSLLNQIRGARYYSSEGHRNLQARANTVINFVPQQEAWIVERFGRYLRTLTPGLNVLIPFVDQIRYVQSLKERALDIPSQSAITEDNVNLHLDGVLYYRVVDPYKTSYGVEDAKYAVVQLAQTTMRSELGKIKLDSVFQERMNLNHSIVEAINLAADYWGISCLRYEIRDIQLPAKVTEAMQRQVEAERKKRANILDSEGDRESAINRAEGQRQSVILASEAIRIEQTNKAKGEAAAILARAHARAESLNVLGKAIGSKNGVNAASLGIAEQYVQAFSQLAKTGNTLLLPEKTGDVSSMVAQAMGIYGHMSNNSPLKTQHPDGDGDNEGAIGDSNKDDKTYTMDRVNEAIDKLDETFKTDPAYNSSPSTRDSEHFSVFDSPTKDDR